MSGSDSTPVHYGRDELDQIREMMAMSIPVVCPKCGGKLEAGGVFDARDSQADVWALTCQPCFRMAILRDITEGP